MDVFESIEKCPLVEKLIWKQIALSCGEFEGVRELTFTDLLGLRSAVDHQLTLTIKNGIEKGIT